YSFYFLFIETETPMNKRKVAINGFGRIGRAALKVLLNIPEFEVIAINDLMDIENAAYLLKHDSVYGNYEHDVNIDNNRLRILKNDIQFFSEKDPARLPWRSLNIDIVIESTGFFTNRE